MGATLRQCFQPGRFSIPARLPAVTGPTSTLFFRTRKKTTQALRGASTALRNLSVKGKRDGRNAHPFFLSLTALRGYRPDLLTTRITPALELVLSSDAPVSPPSNSIQEIEFAGIL